jgi:SAM-dependent methyltransferase
VEYRFWRRRMEDIGSKRIGRLMRIPRKIESLARLIERNNDEEAKIKKVLGPLNRDLSILDVGCGFGKKYQLLESMGFSRIIGVEKNPALVRTNVEEGRNVLSPEEFSLQYKGSEFDLILMSQIIEHFQWDELLAFLEIYLGYLKDNGYLLIASPVYNVAFYDDFDHVKPYSPYSIQYFYGARGQVQIHPKDSLELVNLYFTRSQFRLVYFRSFRKRGALTVPRLANFLLALLFKLSFRVIGKTIVWIGLFRKNAAD